MGGGREAGGVGRGGGGGQGVSEVVRYRRRQWVYSESGERGVRLY